MKKNEFGVWEITLPPTSSGEPAIPHDSKLKVSRNRSRIHSNEALWSFVLSRVFVLGALSEC